MRGIVLFITLSLLKTSLLKAQEKQKDTMYFEYSKNYIKIYDITPNKFYLNDSSSDGTFFFEKIGIENNNKTKEILCLKEYVHSSKYYDKHRKNKLNDYRLWEHLNNYVIYLIKKNKEKTEYIHVRATFEIE